jgi:PIN domain nuclease of toxin-antitoxin system
VRLLLDTHVLVWSLGILTPEPNGSILAATVALMEEETTELYFSPVAVWEVALKNALGRVEFRLDPHVFRRTLLENGYIELAITSEHAAAVGMLPGIHRDPFDRIQIAQATLEGMTLLTNDATILRYPGPIRRA